MSFEDERKDYIEKLKNIINGIDKINAMQNTRIIDAKMQSELEKKKRDAQKFLKKLEQREFEIAVVGLEKAGKSSFRMQSLRLMFCQQRMQDVPILQLVSEREKETVQRFDSFLWTSSMENFVTN